MFRTKNRFTNVDRNLRNHKGFNDMTIGICFLLKFKDTDCMIKGTED